MNTDVLCDRVVRSWGPDCWGRTPILTVGAGLLTVGAGLKE